MKRPAPPAGERSAPGGTRSGSPASTTDGTPRSAADLERLRRRYRWNILTPICLLGLMSVVPVVFGEPTVATAVVAIVAALGGVTASVELVNQRLAPADERLAANDRPFPGRLVAVAVASAAAYIVAALVIDATAFPDGGPSSWFDRQTSWLWVPAVVVGAVAAAAFQRRRIVAVIAGALTATGIAAGTQFALTGGIVWPWMTVEGGLVAFVGAALVYGLHNWDLTLRWHRSHELEAQLAVADERLRFAADLHDVQGHHLQVIALKSELATRLVATDPATATAHMADVEQHARTALNDTRAIVQGYRQVSLNDEVANAARVLAAAGVDGRVDRVSQDAVDDIDDPARHLLGLVVREATTNILRHSQAEQARLALDTGEDHARLDVTNDGATTTAATPGTGLTTLADRLGAAGGALDWGRDGERFTVTARIPLGEERRA